MDAVERPSFESEARKRVYEYVERHGTAKRAMVMNAVSLSAEEFQEELSALKSKGYLAEDGGTLSVDLNVGEVETYESDGVSFTVRPARKDDFEGVVDAIRAVTAEETYVVAESIAEQLLYEDSLARHNSVESRVFFVATVDSTEAGAGDGNGDGDEDGGAGDGDQSGGGSGDVAGWTHLTLPQVDQVRETAEQTVGVREEYRGHGIGSTLLQRGLDWAEANGYRKVYNSVPMTNEHAIEFLDHHGWDTEAIRREHYTIDGEFVDEVMMAYRF